MLKVATAKEMQDIDRITTGKYGIAGTVLMERAGLAVASKITELFFSDINHGGQVDTTRFRGSRVKSTRLYSESQQPPTVIVLCGSGNNGGDGLVVARILRDQGKDIEVFLSARPQDLKGDAKINYHSAVKFGVKIYPIKKFFTRYPSPVTRHCLIVDALLGTGLNSDVRPPLSKIIKKVNALPWPVISIDIPSGISADSGKIMGCAIEARHTVTFGLPKRGHLLYPGAEHAGRLYIEDIGFPKQLLGSEDIRVHIPQMDDMISLLPERPGYSHKRTYGHVLLIAGSKGKTGAAFMAAKACLRTGAGLVTIGVPDSLMKIFQSRVTEEMVLPLPDNGDGTLSYKAFEPILKFIKKKANVLAVGPGISTSESISRLIEGLISNSEVPMVIDADAINAIAGRIRILRKSTAPVILTPHVGEMARLLIQGSRVQVDTTHRGRFVPRFRGSEEKLRNAIDKDRINTALSFAKKTKTHLVLKGAPTIVATPDGHAFVNPTGNPGMATAGTGDVLAGMIAAFLAQRLSPQNAAILGVFMHGLIGDINAEKKGQHSLIASDIINEIPGIFRKMGA
ncbi:MAG: NAD(P)H-hydrate dehydratase [Nitrospirae bacterium]|nr:NAD(P)H-hydrate dehydratase [Nitrospirota bacterium]